MAIDEAVYMDVATTAKLESVSSFAEYDGFS
jgi:hypothetical protein